LEVVVLTVETWVELMGMGVCWEDEGIERVREGIAEGDVGSAGGISEGMEDEEAVRVWDWPGARWRLSFATAEVQEGEAVDEVVEPGVQPALTIMLTTAPSVMPSYSLSSLLSASAFPLKRSRWTSGGGAVGFEEERVDLRVEIGSETETEGRE
jgi:hypothetical protein